LKSKKNVWLDLGSNPTGSIRILGKAHRGGKAIPLLPGEIIAARSNPTIDDYLADVPEDKRAALEKLRKAIKAAAPGGYSAPLTRVAILRWQLYVPALVEGRFRAIIRD